MELRVTFSHLFVTWVFVIPLISVSSESPCDSFGTCSQKCDLVGGRAQCSCVEGFSLRGNRSCIENDSNWKLIFATRANVTAITYSSNSQTVSLSTFLECRPVFVTSDVRNSVIYWGDTQDPGFIYKANLNEGTIGTPEVVVDVGINLPEGLAFDWITGNLYFVDSNLTFIAVCAQNPTRCTLIVHERIQKPRDIALHPNQGIMFWTDWGENACIKKAKMDGSSPTTIVTSLAWPNGIIVDEANSRIYWVDARNDKIESSKFDGADRQITKSFRGHPFGIDIFGDSVFWSDWHANTITRANKFTGGNETVVYVDHKVVLNGLTVMHIAKQPKIRANSCQDLRCSHLCALSGHRAQCLCPAGMVKSGNTCVEDETEPKLLIAQKDTLMFIRIDTVGKDIFEQIPLPSQIKIINTLVYNPINDTIIISEGHSRKIIEYSIKTTGFTVLVENGIVNVTSMDLDIVNENLIWLDIGKGTIEVMSLRTLTKTVALTNIENAHDISFASDRFTLYLSKTATSGNQEIHKISLGRHSNETLFYKFTEYTKPASLTYDQENGKVVVVSSNETFITVRSETFDGSQFTISDMRPGSDHVEDVIQIENQIFWVDQSSEVKVISADKSRFNFHKIKINFNLATNTTRSDSFNRKVLASIPGDIDHLDNFRNNHDCSPKNPNRKKCSHICLAIGNNMLGVCRCSDGFHLSDDGVTCIEDENSHENESTEKQAVETTNGGPISTLASITDHYNDQDDTYTTTTVNVNALLNTTTIRPINSVLEDESSIKKIEGSETKSVGSVFGYVVLAIIIFIMGGIIVFLVIYWKKTRSIPLLTKPYFSNQA